MGVENTEEKKQQVIGSLSILRRILVHIGNVSGELSIGVGQDVLCWTKLFFKCSGHPNRLPFPLSSSSISKQGLKQAALLRDTNVLDCSSGKWWRYKTL